MRGGGKRRYGNDVGGSAARSRGAASSAADTCPADPAAQRRRFSRNAQCYQSGQHAAVSVKVLA